MLNLKKGLALVLAAATAFTFAPVANLGNAVQAEAAEINTKYTISYDVYSITSGTDHSVLHASNQSTTGSVLNVEDGQGFVLEDVQVKGRAGASYKLADGNQTGTVKVLKNATYSSSSSTVPYARAIVAKNDLATGSYLFKPDSDGVLTVDLWITAPGNGQTVTFADVDKPNDVNAMATVTIDLADHQADLDGLDIVKQTNKTTPVDLNTASTYASVKNNNNGVYEFQLNDGFEYYITGLDGGTNKATAWNGVKLNSSNIKVVDDNHYLTFEDVYASAANAKTGFSSTKDSTHSVVVSNVKRVVSHGSTKSSTYSFKVTADTNTKDYSISINNNFTVSPSDNAIDTLSFTFGSETKTIDQTVNNSTKVGEATVVTKADASGKKYWTATGFDTLFNNKGGIDVTAESNDISFKSGDPSIITVDDKGKGHADITAVGVGTAPVYIFVTGTDNNKALVTEIDITVNPWATDVITAPDTIDLDVPSQKAANAKISDILAPKAASGAKVTMKLTDGDCISFNDTTGQINSKEITGTYKQATILLTTPADNTRHIIAGRKTVTVRVWTLPAAQATLKPLVVKAGDNVSLAGQLDVTTPNPYSAVWSRPANGVGIYTLSNPNQGLLHNNDQTTSRLFANKVGTADYQVEILGTSTTRPTTLKEKVTVTDSAVTNVITPDDNSKSVVLEVGSDPVTINVKSSLGTDVTFDDSKLNGVATVAAGATSGSAIVTAVKAGKGVIVAKSTGASDYEIPVVVTEKQQTVAPAKVTSVKVSNKKGAYVSVKWASQGKNINYRVWKKVGNSKWVGKNVAGSKTTLKVKKGAKVQVKVKAYVKDSTGKTTWGPTATKAKTFKTDKK